jgi:hypothetical protein
VYAYPSNGVPIFVGVAAYGGSRPEVAAAFGAQFAGSGYWLTASGLAPGSYQIVTFAHNAATNAFDVSAVASVTIQPPVSRPLAAIDTPAADAIITSPFTLAGWTLDLGAPAGGGVDAIHFYAALDGGSPVFVGATAPGVERPDVAGAFGAQFAASGFSFNAWLAPGSYTLLVYSRSTVSGAFTSVSRHVVVRSAPLMTIDTPANGTQVQAGALLAGWAIDLGSGSDAGIDAVHVWAFPAGGGSPRFLGAAQYGARHDDVAAAFGTRFLNSGYNLVLSGLNSGTYTIVVYARSSVTGTFNQSKQISLAIQ